MKFFFLIIFFASFRLFAQSGIDDPYFRYTVEREILDAQYKELREEYQRDQRRRAREKERLAFEKERHEKKRSEKEKKESCLIALNPIIEQNSLKLPVKNNPHLNFTQLAKSFEMNIKFGVRFDGMDEKWEQYLGLIKDAFGPYGAVITSGTDGNNHKSGKRSHYTGHKLDFRVKHIPGVIIKNRRVKSGKEKIAQIVKKLNEIDGLKAVFEEGKNYPHIDLKILDP